MSRRNGKRVTAGKLTWEIVPHNDKYLLRWAVGNGTMPIVEEHNTHEEAEAALAKLK